MRIIAVDDEEMSVKYMERLVRQVEPQAQFIGFTEADDVLDYLDSNKADVVLLDISLGSADGIDVARRLRELCPQLNIIFVTGYSQYAVDAFRLYASGYLMKPIRADDLRRELQNLRYPLPTGNGLRVRVQTFGNFEIFVDGRPLKLPLTKCRECLAYLIDRRGALVTVAKLANILWEDKPFDNTVRNSVYQVISVLMKSLREEKIEDIIIKHTRAIAIDTSKIYCDYYLALAGDESQLKLFSGEYMNNYSWAEFTVGELEKLANKE